MRLDSFDEFLAGVDVDSGFAIGDGDALGHSDPLLHWVPLGPAGRADAAGSASCGILHQATRGFRDNTMPQYFSVFSMRYLRPAVILCFSLAALCLGDAGSALTRAELYQATAPVPDRSEAAQTRGLSRPR